MNLKEVSKLINYQGSYLACPLYCHLVEFNVRKFLLVHRKELRRRIFEYIEHSSSIKPLSESQKQTFLQPGVIPQIPDLSLSISHGPFLGGFVASPIEQGFIGFDLEEANRANKKVLSYITKATEIKSSPDLTFLWSAKESAFKSVSQSGLKSSIKKIDICHWFLKSKNVYNYEFKVEGCSSIGKGCVFSFEKLVVGLAVYKYSDILD